MEIIIGKELAGLTIKKVLFDRLKFSRAAITSLKTREMGITVNGEHKTVRHVLSEGETLRLLVEDTAPLPAFGKAAVTSTCCLRTIISSRSISLREWRCTPPKSCRTTPLQDASSTTATPWYSARRADWIKTPAVW